MEVVQPIDVGPTNETKGKALGLTRLDATGDQPVGEQLRAALMHNFSRVVDLFRDWDDDRNGTVSRKEFRMVLPVLGLSVPRSEADALFSSIDVDGSTTSSTPPPLPPRSHRLRRAIGGEQCGERRRRRACAA